MNLFHAAVYTNNCRNGQSWYQKMEPNERSVMDRIPHILESYHYVKSQKFVDQMRADNAKVFLDSGAFSAWTLGTKVDINAYCDYVIRNRDILRHEDGICMASVLDSIGNDLGTYQNQLHMEQLGATPLPCFHFGEDDRYLEYYVGRYPYITIGGLVGKSDEDTTNWLDRIWERYMLDGSGRPKLKVHAFGVTRVSMMERYPWYSVDSSSWIQYSVFGHLFFPEFGSVTASSKSPGRHQAGRHLTTLSQPEQEYMRKRLAANGFTFERCADVVESRAAFNAGSFIELNNMLNNHFKEKNHVLDVHAIQQLF